MASVSSEPINFEESVPRSSLPSSSPLPCAGEIAFALSTYIAYDCQDAEAARVAKQQELSNEVAATEQRLAALKHEQQQLTTKDPAHPIVARQQGSEWVQAIVQVVTQVVRKQNEEIQALNDQLNLCVYDYDDLARTHQDAADLDDLLESYYEPKQSSLKRKASDQAFAEAEAKHQKLCDEVEGPDGLRAKAAMFDQLEQAYELVLKAKSLGQSSAPTQSSISQVLASSVPSGVAEMSQESSTMSPATTCTQGK